MTEKLPLSRVEVEKEGFSPLYEEIFEEYKATVSVGSGVFYDRFDGDECLENVLVRAGK